MGMVVKFGREYYIPALDGFIEPPRGPAAADSPAEAGRGMRSPC